MAAPAPHHYAKACGPLIAAEIQTPDPNKPRQHRIICQLQLLDSGETHPVHCHYYTSTPPVPSEMIEFRGSIAHDGTMTAPLNIFVNKVEQFPWADVNDENYLDTVPFGKKLHVTLQGALESNVVDRMFIVAGLIYGNGRNNTFRFKVWIPDNARWTNLPFPTQGQVIMVDGEISRREQSGMYIIDLVDISLPTSTNKRIAVPASPSTSPAKRKQPSRSRPTVEQVDHGSPFQASASSSKA